MGNEMELRVTRTLHKPMQEALSLLAEAVPQRQAGRSRTETPGLPGLTAPPSVKVQRCPRPVVHGLPVPNLVTLCVLATLVTYQLQMLRQQTVHAWLIQFYT